MSVPPVLLRTFEEVLNIFDQYPEAHIVIGYGSKIQYHDLDAVIDELGSWLRNAQKRCGSKPWLLIYGGDMAKEDVHDVGLLVQRMAATFACRVVAPWVSSAADPPPPQPFVNYYYVMEPQYAGDLEGARQLQQQQQQQQQGQSPLSINISLAAHSRDAASRYAGKRSFVEGVGDNSTDEDVNGHLKQRRRLGDNASLQQQESVGQQPSQEQDSFAQTEMAGSKEEQPTEGVPGSIPEPLPVDRVLTAIDDPVDASTRDGNASIMFNPELESAPEPDGASLPLPNTAKPAVRQQQPAEPLSNISITGTTRLEPAGQGKGASSGRGRQLWGGIIDGRPVGPSQFYLNDIMLGLADRPSDGAVSLAPGEKTGCGGDRKRHPLITSILAVGGGPITLQELEYAASRGVPWTYIRCRGRYVTPGSSEYGPVDAWAQQQQQQQQKQQEQEQADGEQRTQQGEILPGLDQGGSKNPSGSGPGQ